MEGLNFNNVMSAEEIFSFFDEETSPPSEENKDTDIDNKDTNITEEIGNPFEDDDTPESVGDGNDKEGSEVQTHKSSSSHNNFSSIASTLKELGTFEDLSDEDILNIKDAQGLLDAIEKQVQNSFDERQKRIDNALNGGIAPSVVNQYENVISNLEAISEDHVKNEDDNGVQLRKNLIYQDFINRGYSKERAEKEVNKSFNAGTDIEDALEALESNKQFYISQYNNLVSEHNSKLEAEKQARIKQAETLKNSILDDDNTFKDLSVDKSTRKKIYESITKPVYRDPETKQQYTAIQKYALDNPADFQKYLGLVFTLTNGFKDFQGLVKGPTKKAVKDKVKQLEETINNSKTIGGNPNFFGGSPDPNESFPSWKIDF